MAGVVEKRIHAPDVEIDGWGKEEYNTIGTAVSHRRMLRGETEEVDKGRPREDKARLASHAHVYANSVEKPKKHGISTHSPTNART